MQVGKEEHLNTKIFKDFFEITKSRLSISVVFSSITGYLLATETVDTLHIMYLFIGGFCMVGASNALNQVIERDYDAVMKRTQNRPIPQGRISISTALIISLLMIVIGFFLLNKLNFKTAFFSFFFNLNLRLHLYSFENNYPFIGFYWSISRSNSIYAWMGLSYKQIWNRTRYTFYAPVFLAISPFLGN